MISLSSVTASIAAVIGVLLFPLFGFILNSYDPLFILIILALASDYHSSPRIISHVSKIKLKISFLGTKT